MSAVIEKKIRKDYTEAQQHLAVVISWIKGANRENLKEYFGTAGLELLDKLTAEADSA